jgi:hypothetical protein
MFSRILFSTIAAGALVVAAPALANDTGKDADSREIPACCEHVAMQMHHDAVKDTRGSEHKPAPVSTDDTAKPAVEEDPFVRNQSWGG